MKLKEKKYVSTIPRGITIVIGADIGGTNSNFGIFHIKEKQATLLISLHAKSQEITNFSHLVKEVVHIIREQYDMKVHVALFAAAGVTTPDNDYSKPTNLSISIDAHDIKKVAGLDCVYIVNDFEVIGYGIDQLAPEDILTVKEGMVVKGANKAILGAGTGLGKCIMFWNTQANRYVPVASEGGHADCALQHLIELELAQFIKTKEQRPCNISWEDILSGNGISRIYQFFHQRSGQAIHAQDEQQPHPDEIFKDRNNNNHSKDTFDLYTTMYARCAKSFVLDALALGGIYFAGGIAANNIEMFSLPIFTKEFLTCGKQSNLLKRVPIYVIKDYNVSLYGAVQYLIIENLCT